MRFGGLLVAVVLLVAIIAALVMIVGGSEPRLPEQEPPEERPDVITLADPVPYCPAALSAVAPARVQVLLDSSGSMAGVRPSVIGIVRWLDQTISRMRDSAAAIEQLRLAGFDQTRGFVESPTFTNLAAAYAPSGRTTLHEAIAAARDYDLTFIVTDGVAAAGSGSGACAAGVDAACVARALKDAVHVEQTTSVAPQPGIWLVPLWVRHSGIFFTEKPGAAADFDGTASLKKVYDELGQDVAISNARSDSEANLVFDYTGPRGILLIVIAHSDDLGRRAVAALRERMADNGVRAITSIRQGTGPLSAFPPMELYPGYLPRMEWTRFTESADKPVQGTLDASFVNARTIGIECAAGRRNEGDFVLESRRLRGAVRCVEILQLPAFEFGFIPRNEADQASVASFIAATNRTTSGESETFDLTLQCGEGGQRPCGSDPLSVTWMAQSRYDRSHAGDHGATGADALISSIATTDLATQPHRIYGLDSLISIFFDEVRQDRRRIPLADLELCHGRPEGK